MDPLDTAMWIGEVLSNPMHTAALLILSPPDDAGPGYVDEVYREGLIAGKDLDPRLRRRAHRGLDTLGMWVWQDVDDVDVREHLQRRTLPKGSGEDALWRLVAELHAERLDRSRPLWMTYLIDGLPDGRFAYYVKVHHIVVDGVAGMRMISDALTTDPTQRSMKPFYAAGPHAPADRAGTGRAIPNPVSVLRSIGGTATSTIGFLRQVAGGEASYLAAGLAEGTTVLPLSAPFTRLNGRLGPQRAVAGGTWPKKRIKAVQEAAGVSGNDVLMAVVAGVLRSWLSGRDELPKRSLVAFCPITVRVSGDKSQAEHANLFGLELCPLGTDLENPAERLALIHRAHRAAIDDSVRTQTADRLQRADLQCPRPGHRHVFQRRASRRAVSGVNGFRRTRAQRDDVLIRRSDRIRLRSGTGRGARHRVVHTADRTLARRVGGCGWSDGLNPAAVISLSKGRWP